MGLARQWEVASKLIEGDGGQPGLPSNERIGQESSEIAQIRRFAKNTLELQCAVLNDYELKDVSRLIACVLQIFVEAHSIQNKTCRSRHASLNWHWEQSCGKAFGPILGCAKLFHGLAAQEEAGILFASTLQAQLVGLAVDSPLVVVQGNRAHTLGHFTTHFLWRYMTAATWYCGQCLASSPGW